MADGINIGDLVKINDPEYTSVMGNVLKIVGFLINDEGSIGIRMQGEGPELLDLVGPYIGLVKLDDGVWQLEDADEQEPPLPPEPDPDADPDEHFGGGGPQDVADQMDDPF